MWWSGSIEIPQSSGLIFRMPIADITSKQKFLWQSITPFEVPVVPEVKIREHIASGSITASR